MGIFFELFPLREGLVYYNCIKYKNSPYYKGALLWDSLSVEARNSTTLKTFKAHLKNVYRLYDSKLT